CVSALLIGIGYGTLFPALQTIYINMAPSAKRGTANSTYLTGFDLGIGLGMLVGAYLNGRFGFESMYLFTGMLCLLSIFVYWFNSRRVYEKNKVV
ncbi:MAG: MFS transporter, partial [Bacteroidetes bacterium]|nr:MFS transporter [Bacteroidota bacterium]